MQGNGERILSLNKKKNTHHKCPSTSTRLLQNSVLRETGKCPSYLYKESECPNISRGLAKFISKSCKLHFGSCKSRLKNQVVRRKKKCRETASSLDYGCPEIKEVTWYTVVRNKYLPVVRHRPVKVTPLPIQTKPSFISYFIQIALRHLFNQMTVPRVMKW